MKSYLRKTFCASLLLLSVSATNLFCGKTEGFYFAEPTRTNTDPKVEARFGGTTIMAFTCEHFRDTILPQLSKNEVIICLGIIESEIAKEEIAKDQDRLLRIKREMLRSKLRVLERIEAIRFAAEEMDQG
jgi:hypothetical protein